MTKKKSTPRKMKAGGPVAASTTIHPDVAALFTPENLANAMYQLRYGVNSDQKVRLADTGNPLGVSPEEAQLRPDEADRAASAYLGTQKWGPFAAMALNEIRNNSGLARLMGEDPAKQAQLRNAAILASSRALQKQSGGKVRPNPLTIAPSYPDAVPMGMVEPGNIDLYRRPDVNGSTVRSLSFERDGREVLIPTVVGDQILSDDDAIAAFERLGQHLGIFTNPKTATEYAKRLHDDYETGRIPVQKKQSGGKVAKSGSSGIRVPAKWLVQGYALGGPVKQQLPQNQRNTGVMGPAGSKMGVKTGSPILGQPLTLDRFGGQKSSQQQLAQPQNVVGTTFDAANKIGADPTQVNRTAGLLENFNPNIQADTGAMLNTAGRLGNFNPLTGAAGDTLQGFIQTGNAVDVNPMVQAAQMRAQQGFNDFLGQSNESFGALGLGSSSARAAAQAREAGRLQQGIAATGLEAGVAAQEAARNRQLQAFNPLLAGSGQQLSGLQSSGALQGEAAGLGLNAQTSNAGMRLSGLQSAGGLRSDVMNSQLQGQIGRAGQLNNLSGTLVPPAIATNMQPSTRQTAPVQKKPLFGGFGRAFAAGGRVDLGDFLGQVTFGQTFNRPRAEGYGYEEQQPRYRAPQPDYEAQNAAQRDAGMAFERQKELMGLQRGWQLDAARAADRRYGLDMFNLANSLLSNNRSFRDPGDINRLTGHLRAIGPELAHAGTMQVGRLFANQGGTGPSSPAQAGFAQRTFQPGNAYWSSLIHPPQKQEGGVIDGPSVPPDQVPILAQGGEGVIPIKLMHKLENAKQTKQLAAVAREIQQLMGKEPELNDRDIQRKARGGKIAKVMHEFKAGSLRSGGPEGPVVTDRKQAIAIALSEARKEEGQHMASGGLIQRISAFQPQPPPQLPTRYQRDFSNAEGTFPSGATVAPGNRFELQGDPNAAPEFSPGRFIDPTEDAQKLYEEARGRSALLRTLAIKSPQGALAKMAPLIGRAEQEEMDALKNLQLTEERVSREQQNAAQRQHMANEGAANRASQEKQADIQARGAVGAASARNPFNLGGPPPVGAPAPMAEPSVSQGAMIAPSSAQAEPDPVDQLFALEDPAEIERHLSGVDWDQAAPNPKATQMAQERLMQLIAAGATDEEITTRYANLYRLAGGQ